MTDTTQETDFSQYLGATQYLDHDTPSIVEFVERVTAGVEDSVEAMIGLFYAVRDEIRYDPYSFIPVPETFRASGVLKAGKGFCIPKAILLAAAARAWGVPSRLGFADVKNHMTSARLAEMMRTDIFAYHGYTELFLEGRWIKVTPAFDRALCEKLGVAALEFDGKNEAVFQELDHSGNRFMDYILDRGHRADFPFEEVLEAMREFYPHFFAANPELIMEEGDFASECEAEHN